MSPNSQDAPDLKRADTVEIDSFGAGPASTQATSELQQFKKSHKWDPFLDTGKLDVVDTALRTGDEEKESAVKAHLQEDSPYPEVRSSVCSSTPHFPLLSFRPRHFKRVLKAACYLCGRRRQSLCWTRMLM